MREAKNAGARAARVIGEAPELRLDLGTLGCRASRDRATFPRLACAALLMLACGPGATPTPADGGLEPADAGPIVTLDGSSAPDAGSPIDEDAGAVTPPPLGPGFAAELEDPCEVLTPTIRGTDGADRLVGTSGPDVIFAGAGDDVIFGNGGDDVICAGGGADEIDAGGGNDYVDAGFGRDVVDGGPGNDTLHGRSGGDLLRGGEGDDVLYGDLLDDDLFGDDGDDLLIGGHGIDHMHGGTGNDWLRGDTNRDELIGGVGVDTASFITATPPGQPLGTLERADGVLVDVRDISNGLASGDGYQETLQGVEIVHGSPFDDRIVTGAGILEVHGELGDDDVDGDTGDPFPRGEGPYVALATGPRDLGLVVLGGRGAVDDALTISMADGVVIVRATNGATITAGEGCTAVAASEVRCVTIAELRYVVGYGGEGDDTIALEGSGFPRDLTTTLDGGDGDDHLVGHGGQDILFAGASGHDVLEGGASDDALLSESMDGDVMDAGAGNDQLVANYPCAGHQFIGGDGFDVGGFARVGTSFDTAAERRRQSIHAQIGFRSYQPAFCEREEGTQLANDIEILEGAGGDDELIGNDEDNVIWGWGGDDVIRGRGGNDVIEGHEGDDQIYGGSGQDRLRGNAGNDVIHARDGERDFQIDCGGGGSAETDSVDPATRGCS